MGEGAGDGYGAAGGADPGARRPPAERGGGGAPGGGTCEGIGGGRGPMLARSKTGGSGPGPGDMDGAGDIGWVRGGRGGKGCGGMPVAPPPGGGKG